MNFDNIYNKTTYIWLWIKKNLFLNVWVFLFIILFINLFVSANRYVLVLINFTFTFSWIQIHICSVVFS